MFSRINSLMISIGDRRMTSASSATLISGGRSTGPPNLTVSRRGAGRVAVADDCRPRAPLERPLRLVLGVLAIVVSVYGVTTLIGYG